MRIRVRLFAMQRQQTGLRELALEVADDATVAAAWDALATAHPVLAPAASSVRFARNGRYAEASDLLAEGDELAVIPPVSGGAGEPPVRPPGPPVHPPAAPGSYRQLELHAEPFADGLLDELRRVVASPSDGAVSIFVGQTRESPGTPAPGQEAEAERFAGRRVERLEYEAFETMAVDTFGTIADEMLWRWGVRRLAILHRVGEVPLGAASVIVVTAAAHREDAFAACRYAIEELKARAPIWKAEWFADGSVWVGAPARSGPPHASDDLP